MPEYDVQIELRELTPKDIYNRSEAWRWVVNSWLKSHYERGRSMWADGHPREYWTQHWELATRLIERAGVLIAHQPGAPDLFLGWVCTDPVRKVCHYVYVKHAFRRGGVATRLLSRVHGPRPVLRYTHQPARAQLREAADKLGWTYSPYALMESLDGHKIDRATQVHTGADAAGAGD